MLKPLFVCLALLPTWAATALASETTAVDVTIVLTGDTESLDGDRSRGGFARLASVIRSTRADNDNVLVIHAGDVLSPSRLAGVDQGAHRVALLNILKPDIFVPGSHEFDFGVPIFLKRIGEMQAHVLTANLRDAGGKPLAGTSATALRTIGGIRIGFVGATHAAYLTGIAGLKSEPSLRTAYSAGRALRENGADIVILVGHLPRHLDRYAANSGVFDLVLSGGDHLFSVVYDGRVLIAEAGANARKIPIIRLTFNRARHGPKRIDWQPDIRIVDTINVPPDQAMAAETDALRKGLNHGLDTVIGRTATVLDSTRNALRGGETAIGNLICDAMRAATFADIALINGGSIRGNRRYRPGTPLTRRDILAELPFDNRTVLLEITGKDLKRVIEESFSEKALASGAPPQISGMRVIVDARRPPGDRVVGIQIGGKPLENHRNYRLAVTDFMAKGGAGFFTLRRVKLVRDFRRAAFQASDVISYIQKRGVIEPRIENRLVLEK